METTITKSFTAIDLQEISKNGRYELIKGDIKEMAPAGEEHGLVASLVIQVIGNYVRKNKLGITTSSETGYKLSENPDTVKAPDMAFKSNKTLAKKEVVKGYSEVMPDLVVEVNSPNDKYSDVVRKVEEWLNSGVMAVWVIDPGDRSLSVYDSSGNFIILNEEDEIEGKDILPNFKCKVKELFEF